MSVFPADWPFLRTTTSRFQPGGKPFILIGGSWCVSADDMADTWTLQGPAVEIVALKTAP